MNKFLTEYVFDTSRLETGVKDFKLDIAIRGDLAMCICNGKHKADRLVNLAQYLLEVPVSLLDYVIEKSLSYFDIEDVTKIIFHIKHQIPLTYLFIQKNLSDLNEVMQQHVDAKKSIFCRFIEDLCKVDMYIVKDFLLYTLEDYSSSYLKDVAQVYLIEVNEALKEADDKVKERYDTVLSLLEKASILDAKLLTSPKTQTELTSEITEIEVENDEILDDEPAPDLFSVLNLLRNESNKTGCRYKVVKYATDLSHRKIAEPAIFDTEEEANGWINNLKRDFPQVYNNFEYRIEKVYD